MEESENNSINPDNTSGKDAMMCPDRAGDTSQRCGQSPAFLFPAEFTPPDPAPSPLTFPELGQRLIESGFAGDPDVASFLVERLSYTVVRQYCSVIERSGTLACDIETLHKLIDFDRALRTIFMKWIGVFESQFRASYANAMALEHGPFAHRLASNFKNPEYFDELLETYSREIYLKIQRGDKAIEAALEKDGDLPIWKAVEIMSLGALSKMYRNSASEEVRFKVADTFRVKYAVLSSWLRTVSEIRNRCAHFESLVCKPVKIKPKKMPCIAADNGSIFYIVLILEQLTQTGALHKDIRTTYDLGVIKDILALAQPSLDGILPLAGFPGNWRDEMATASTAITAIHTKRPGTT